MCGGGGAKVIKSQTKASYGEALIALRFQRAVTLLKRNLRAISASPYPKIPG